MSRENEKNPANNFLLGDTLKILRKTRDLTLEQFAKDIDINYESVKGYEHNNIKPPLKNLLKISFYFEISLDFLILRDETVYSRNLKLIKLARQIEVLGQPARELIKLTALTLLKDKSGKLDLKIDDIGLSGEINDNIRQLRDLKKATQAQLADYLEVSQNQIYLYEKNSVPPIDKLIKLSRFFEVSIHSLATGEKLAFDFNDQEFGQAILAADHFLPLADHQVLIRLMEAVVEK